MDGNISASVDSANLSNVTGDLSIIKTIITAGNNSESDIVSLAFDVDKSGLI